METGICSDTLLRRRFTAYGRTVPRTRFGLQILRRCCIFLFKSSLDFNQALFALFDAGEKYFHADAERGKGQICPNGTASSYL